MIKKKLYFIFILFALFSCTENEPTSEIETGAEDLSEKINAQIESDEALETSKIIAEIEPRSYQIDYELLQINFKEFMLEIDSLEYWDEGGKLKELQEDTARVYLELSATIQGQKLRINQLKKGEIKIFQRFENSVTIMGEGPHCDLTEWEHYYSEWKELKIDRGEFVADKYSDEDWEKFIDVDMNEFREAVRKHCGDGWADMITGTKSPNEYPSGVSHSRIFLKVLFTDHITESTNERIISFEIPMGC